MARDVRVADEKQTPGWFRALEEYGREQRPEPPRSAPQPRGSGYAAAALAGECQIMRATSEGCRNTQLNTSALKLGGLVGQGITEQQIRDELGDAARASGLPWREVERTLDSGLTAGMNNPRQIPEPAEPVIYELTADELAHAGLNTQDADARFSELVARQVQRRRAQQAAEAILAAEAAEAVTLPPRLTLHELLQQPDDPVAWRIEGLWPQGGRVLLPAPAKAGKSTLVGNVLRSLADGTPFLDAFAVSPVQRVLLIDDELSPRALRLWLDEQGIRNRAAVDVVSLRGRTSAFTILEPHGRARWAEYLAGVDVLVIDCLRPILDSLKLDESHDGGQFVAALDELCQAAGIGELLLIHHTGHAGERSRGDSRLIDWPDAVWKLERDAPGDDEAMSQAPRYFSAYGRDVDEPQHLLRLDGRRLSIAGGGRASVKASAALADVREVLADGDELSQRQILAQLADSGHTKAAVKEAIRQGIDGGQILTSRGERRAILHRINPQCASAPECASSAPDQWGNECASAPIGRTAHSLTTSNPQTPSEPGALTTCPLHPTEPKPEACYTCEVNARGE